MPSGLSLNANTLAPSVCELRLTVQTGVAVSTADQLAQTTVYATPSRGNRLGLFDGVATWRLHGITTDLALALGTKTAALPYDVFCYDNAGDATLEDLAWTSTTARATALTTQDGVLVKSGALTRRYLGTYVTTSTTQTEDSAANRYLFNYYNQAPRVGSRTDTGSHVINNQAIREYGGGTLLRINFVIGVVEKALTQAISIDMQYGATAANALFFNNLNGVTGTRAQWFNAAGASGQGGTVNATDAWIPALGVNYVTVSEQEAASQNCTVGANGRNRAVIWG